MTKRLNLPTLPASRLFIVVTPSELSPSDLTVSGPPELLGRQVLTVLPSAMRPLEVLFHARLLAPGMAAHIRTITHTYYMDNTDSTLLYYEFDTASTLCRH